jgi:isopentenyldiphosphate isomerase
MFSRSPARTRRVDGPRKELSLEQFDVLDCTGRKTGGRIGRDEAHAAGVWHGAFHCLMVYRYGGRELALFQKRSGGKKIAPGLYDVSVGGHYAAGEDAAAAGPREIREELGLSVPFSSLVPVGRRVFVYCFTPGVFEYEFQDVFLLPLETRPADLLLQAEEVDAVLEVDVEAAIAFFAGTRTAAQGRLLEGRQHRETVTVALQEFVPCIDSYYLKLLLLAQRYFRGERDALAI